MAMNMPSGGGDDDPDVVVDINTTPLIDVMLVLLIMLIITIPLQTNATKMDLPVGNPPAQQDPPPSVNIDVDFDGLVYWNGAVVADQAELDGRLRAIAAQPQQPEVHLKPNKLVTYSHVIAVLAAAQRYGVNKIGLVGNEQFVD